MLSINVVFIPRTRAAKKTGTVIPVPQLMTNFGLKRRRYTNDRIRVKMVLKTDIILESQGSRRGANTGSIFPGILIFLGVNLSKIPIR
jgi:hypothetical protein